MKKAITSGKKTAAKKATKAAAPKKKSAKAVAKSTASKKPAKKAKPVDDEDEYGDFGGEDDLKLDDFHGRFDDEEEDEDDDYFGGDDF